MLEILRGAKVPLRALPRPGAHARAPDRLEIELELAHRLAGTTPEPARWASYIVRHSPNDVMARLGMADALMERFASGKQLAPNVRRLAAGRWLVESATEGTSNVHVFGDAPGHVSCDCPDFLGNSLGTCKHAVYLLSRGLIGFAEAPVLDWLPLRPWVVPAADGTDALWSRLEFRGRSPVSQAPWVPWREGRWRLGPMETKGEAARAVANDLSALVLRLGPLASPAARNVVGELEAHVGRLALFARDARKCAVFVKATKRSLFAYQQEGVDRLLHQGALLLGDDMGLGKTTQAAAAAAALLRSGAIQRALFVVPAPLKTQWAREWAEVTSVAITLVDGGKKERRAILERTRAGALLMSYEQVVRDADALRKWEPHLMVLDEAQRIKNKTAQRSVVMKSFSPRYRWALTGTPFENRLEELASLLEWIDWFAMEPKWRLDCFHTERADGETTVAGAKNISTLRERIKPWILRRRRADVLAELPERTDVVTAVPFTEWQCATHDAYNRDIGALMSIRTRRPMTAQEVLRVMKLLNRQRMISNVTLLPNDAEAWDELRDASPPLALPLIGSPKLEAFREMVRELVVGRGKKVAVFSQWTRMLKWAYWSVRDLLEEENVQAGFFTGVEPESRRRENVIRFHDDDSFRLLFLSDAGGVGLNLQRAASHLVNLELPWNPAVLEQRIGRIHRFGQKSPVTVNLLCASEGIESRIAFLVGDKRALFHGVFDGESDTVIFERSGGFLARLERVLPKDSAPASPRVEYLETDDVFVCPAFSSLRLVAMPTHPPARCESR